MFKKRPEIKNLSPLRSSDRRKLADQIIKDYDIPVPSSSSEQTPAVSEDATAASSSPSQPALTLSSLRNSLLPDSTSSARFTTTSGPNQTLLVGTIYVGAHDAGGEQRILWFQIGKAPKMIPTVYTLWQNPGIVPLLHTPDFVVEQKLSHGSDLMIPGLVARSRSAGHGNGWDARAKKGAVVAVAGLKKDTVPMWVGTCDVDVSRLGNDLRGQKGVAVKGLHWAGDEVWSWRPLGSGGREAPEGPIEGWPGLAEDMTSAIKDMKLEDDEDEDEGGGGGGVALKAASANDSQQSQSQSQSRGKERSDLAEVVDVPEPTTKEVDDAFFQAFLFALHKAKADNSPPHYGFDFPILPSYLIANMIHPHLKHQNDPHYNIKKTSWKNAKKFIKHLDKLKLLKSKDRSGGETVILDIDFEDAQIANFRPYALPKPKPSVTASGGDAPGDASTSSSSTSDPSVGQKISIQILYRVSSKLVPTLLPSKTEFYTGAQIAAAVKAYIDRNPELTGGQGASSIKLDPFLANNVLGSNPTPDDQRTIAAGRIMRGALQRRVVDDSHLCQPFHLMVRGDSSENQQSQHKPKSGPPPQIHLTIEKRTGTKVVTKITNLEPFFIDPQLVAPELQKKCAGSASVGQLTGGRPGLSEVVVQGDQRKVIVGDVLARRGVDSRWVEVVDKTKGKKK
ncbi:hypothetical protein PG996_002959 [Apiospora saccharicola]|uniref:SUI1 domain-containing protein n=1 Tax=Apiospora saccharicola TaxID=335842 RepID=A0ABR1WKZ7_9PEZI